MLESLNLEQEIIVLRKSISISSLSKRDRLLKRLRLLETFVATKTDPCWMVLTVLPVLPPALRPVFELPNGTYMSSEFNEHYRRIVMRNNRLIRFCEQIVPDFVVINEKILIQDAVDDLIDNGSRFGRESYGPRNKPLRCLNDLIAGKEGRFRQNLLGKRVDYSGRSVIVVGPTLMLDQCALPYEMALNLFGPYLIYKIREIIPRARELDTSDLTSALQRNYPIVWTLLTILVSVSLVLLNRAPTLHRLGIQAFRPILTTGRAIQLHPLVCPGFNADFDGDQMGVHLPLTRKTQYEAYRMLSSNNLLSPATGRPILTPSQDIVLGWFYITTRTLPNIIGANRYFTTFGEISEAFEHGKISLHSSIWLKYTGKLTGIKNKPQNLIRKEILKDGSSIEIFEDIQIKRSQNNKINSIYIRTTAGRVLINELLAAAIFARPIGLA
jgi:DNA-directed RNA polymerase subunit beta'